MKQHLRTIAFGLVLTALIALLAETAWRDVRGKVVSAKREVMRFGFIDKSGAYVIEPEYEFADDFSEGLAPVVACFACLTVAWACVALGMRRG